MTRNKEIKDILKEGETNAIEFKINANKKSIGNSVSALLNSEGGRVLIGISDKGEIKGIDNVEQVSEDLRKHLIEEIVPDTPIDLSIEHINDKAIIILKVSEGSKQPYIYDGNIYYRRGSNTVKATSKEISRLIHQREVDEQHWERQVFLGFAWDDLDHKLIKNTLIESKENYRSSYQGNDLQEFLNHYGLMTNGAYTNACVILFSKNTSKFLPQSRVRITEYANSKTDNSLIRDEALEGNLFVLRDKLESYIYNLGTKSHFDDKNWKRIDFRYPVKALQEGIINALMHRDYSSYNSQLTISIYPDKLVIANSGKLPEEIAIRDLKKNHRSFPVNPDIAHIVFLRGLIDKLGRGTVKINEECKIAGLKSPTWKQSKGEVILTFNGPLASVAKRHSDLKNKSIDATNDAISDAVNTAISDAINDAISDATNDAVKSRLKQELVLLYIEESLSLRSLQDTFDVGRATMQRDMTLMNENKLIDFTGSNKTRKYIINKDLMEKLKSL
ncbi:RNA-binding domain-containing protein [Wocania ichthyoenteri]|uniref:RNA-binding domain-containing protein n=1 Tax=Wocania ichthyoenteri TaxID=1230531 RepID=UPI00053E38DE|nr:RNA-binding domain-containing protein [Wocania ichthyoenteri]